MSQLGSRFHYWFLNLKRLFHLVITLAFMVLTLVCASQTYVAWQDYRKAPDAGLLYWQFPLYGAVTLLVAILGLYSFVKARNVR